MSENTLGQRIAQRRKMLSMSQEAFGEKMGVSRQAASKWEADAAVPEIDKLINMSKLFDVSVGWLLGVETPEQNDSDSPPEGQIQFQFQPPEPIPEPATPPEAPAPEPVPVPPAHQGSNWLTTVCAIAAAVSIVLNLISMALYDRLAQKVSEPVTQDPAISELQTQFNQFKNDTDEQIESLEYTINYLVSNMNQQDYIANDFREFMEMHGDGTQLPTPDSLLPVYENLSTWSLTAQKTTDFTKIQLTFSATSTVNLRSARIEALKNGKTVAANDCSVAGKRLVGELTLTPDTDLEYRLALTHNDKTIQTITLEGHGLSDLVVLSQPIVRSTPREVHLFPENLYFVQGWMNLYVALPHLADETAQYEWGDIRITYYQNGVEMSEHSIDNHVQSYYSAAYLKPYLSFQVPGQTFQMQYFEELDVHSLYLEGTLTVNGVPMEFSAPLREWVVRDGQFFSVAA